MTSTAPSTPERHPLSFAGHPHMRWLVVLAVIGLAIYFFKQTEVFPSASIDLTVPKDKIARLAYKWSDDLHYPSQGAIKSTIFSFDESTKTFLEYELGLSRANQLMKEEIPVWYWTTRLCRPLNLEEISVSLSPSGALVAFDHSLESDRAMPSLTHNDARLLAMGFVEKQAGLSLGEYKSVEDGTVAQLHRTDHYFTWESTKREFHGARPRISTYVAGNQITSFNQFLYVPEVWLRKFSELRSYNKALEEVASIFYVAFSTGTFFAFVWVFASGLLRWRFALCVSLVMGALELLESLNSLPLSLHNYTTTMSYQGYVLDLYVTAGWGALSQLMQNFVLVGAAEGIYRLMNPQKIALERIFIPVGLRCREVFHALAAGHCMFAIHLGWVMLYYLFGRELGMWSPLEVRNVEGLSSVFPFFSAMYVGSTASLFEELTYRVLGMLVFQKLVKHFWIANLLQAAAWAFMHSNYPQEPPYARGLELTVVGAFYGVMLKRFGLISCIVSHYVFDAWLGVSPLLSSNQLPLQVSALGAAAPFAVAFLASLVLILRKGQVSDESVLSNAHIQPLARPSEMEEIFPSQEYHYERLSSRVRKGLAVFACVAALVQFACFFPIVGQHARLTMSRNEALVVAREYLLSRGIHLKGHHEVAWLARGVDAQALQYVFEKAGFARAASLCEMPGHPLVWQVRFFRPLDPEEYLVTIDSEGHVLSQGVVLPEDAPGARLDQESARKLTESYVILEHKEMLPFKFEDAQEERRKNRTDWTIHFAVPKFKVAEADFKIVTNTVGSMLSHFDQNWDVPQSWVWERSRRTTKDQVCGYLVAILGLILVLAGIWWITGVARSGAIRWRPAILLSLCAALLVIPQALNDLPEFYVGYGTDTPFLSYFVAQCVRQVITGLSTIAMAAGLAAFGLASFRLLFPRLSVASIIKAGLTRNPVDGGQAQRDFWLDALLVGYAAGLGQRAFAVGCSAVHSYVSPVATLAPLESFCALTNVLSPSLDAILDTLSRGISYVLVSAVLVGVYAKFFTHVRQYALCSLLFSLIYPSTSRYWQDYLLNVLIYLVYFAGSYFVIAKLARQNVLAYFFAAGSGVIAGSIRVLLNHGSEFYAQDIAILAFVLASPIVYVAVLFSRRGSAAPIASEPESVSPDPEPEKPQRQD